MKPTQTLGLILWRTGILILAGYFLFLALRLFLHITDRVLEVGVTLVLAGAPLRPGFRRLRSWPGPPNCWRTGPRRKSST